jgi:hypothetical protein
MCDAKYTKAGLLLCCIHVGSDLELLPGMVFVWEARTGISTDQLGVSLGGSAS